MLHRELAVSTVTAVAAASGAHYGGQGRGQRVRGAGIAVACRCEGSYMAAAVRRRGKANAAGKLLELLVMRHVPQAAPRSLSPRP